VGRTERSLWIIVGIIVGGRNRMNRCKKYSPEALEGIKQALIETRDVGIVAGMLGTTRNHLYGIIRRQHWKLNLKRKLINKRGLKASTIEKAHKMAAMRKEGMTLEEIGKRLKVTRERVRQLLNGIGIETCKRGKVDVCNAIKMLEDGIKIEDISKHFGVCDSTLRMILKSEWIGHLEVPPREKRPYVPRRKWDIDEAYDLYLKGWTHRELAEKVGIKPVIMSNALYRYRQRLGLEKRK
jgi:lambda repressor-like predicted transcriptional regulator